MELTPDLQEKKIFLIEGLKRTYKKQYDAIQPLPYIKDRLYCVDKVFVEGGIEVCLAPELTLGTGGSWERLESYKSVYTDSRFKSKRRIIQGEPGYGKSTLTLQLAYDWCNDVSDSAINNVEILILLRLRQLGRVKHLFGAIKLFLLSHEPRVSQHDIEKIINSCSSVHITLDGYDEYPGRDINDNDDVHRIIKMELFADFDVSLTTRYLPEYLRKETERAKLSGFDDKARDEYIRKAVVGENDEAVEKIKQQLYENSFLADLCQVPLIFVMFAHMAHDQRDFMKFKSVTQFFKHIIRCFYDHLKKKFKDNRSSKFYPHEMKHHDELDKIAFEGLNKKNQQLSWIKTKFCQRVGLESYHQYISIGILVEEDVVSDDSTGDNVLFTTEVRFYHKLFCEWFAAHHLVTLVTLVKKACDIKETLRFLDPVDLQYLFRFACGLDNNAGRKLINHLKRLPGGETFAILCILEQTGDVNDIMDSVKDLCSRKVKIQEGDSALLQRSTTQLLEIASKNDIPISCLRLKYSSIKFEGDTIILHSGIPLPTLPTVEKIHIAASNTRYGNTGTLTDIDFLNLVHYGMKCGRVKELMFDQLQLPTSFSPEAFTDIMKTQNIQVQWRPFDIDFHLDIQNGHWEIPISCLHLDYSSIKFEGDTIMLHSGISLPLLPTVEKIHIAGSNAHHDNTKTLSGISYGNQYRRHDVAQSANQETLTEKDILNLFRYGMKCRRIKELMFSHLQLPTSVSPEAITDIMKTCDIRVRRRLFDIDFHLDLQNGHWEVDNIDTLRQRCSDTIHICKSDDILKQTFTVMFIHSASRQAIPISCLQLDYSSIKFEGDTIILHSGISLPILPTVEKIHIAGSDVQHDNTETYPGISYRGQYRRHDDAQSANQDTLSGISYRRQHRRQSTQYDDAQSANQETLTEKDVLNWFRYGMKCRRIKELMFHQLQLPNSLSPEAITNIMKTRNIQVRWRPFDIDFHLDLQSGQWEVDDIQVILNKNSGTVSLSERNNILQDTSTLQLLEVACNHDIPVSILHLEYSSMKFEGDTIILHSGIPLPIYPTVEKIHIDASNIEHDNMESLSGYRRHGNEQYGMKRTLTVHGSTGTLRENMFSYRNLYQQQYEDEQDMENFDMDFDEYQYLEEHNPETLTDNDLLNLFHYGMKCGRVNELMFNQFQLPTSVSPNAFTDKMKTQKIQVRWRPFDINFHLDLETGHWEVDNTDTDTLRQLCSDTVHIRKSDDTFKQKYTIMFIHIASSHEIPISCLYLNESFSKIDAGDVILHSGLRLSCPASVKKVVIQTEEGREMTETEVVDILMFVKQSHMLEKIEFDGCLLPLAFSSESIPAELQSRMIKVFWSNYGYSLDLQSGIWKVNEDEVRKLCTKYIYIQSYHSELQQRCTIQLLENASNYGIPILCLYLVKSFSKIDAGDVILHSGLRLSCPVSVKKVVIFTERGREMTETEVVDILMFVKQSHMLKELTFLCCRLPLSIPAESIPSILKSRNVKVAWQIHCTQLQLNFQYGQWMDGDMVLG